MKPYLIFIVFIVAIIVFSLITAIQTVDQIIKFSVEIKTFSGKTLSEKESHLFGLPYEFAVFCHEHLPGKHKGEFITDLDIKEPDGMTQHTRLYYHLYPINIVVKTDEPADCYIIFQKKSAQEAMPKDAKTIYTFDQSNILAVKEDVK